MTSVESCNEETNNNDEFKQEENTNCSADNGSNVENIDSINTSKFVFSPVKIPTHFHHPEYIKEVNNNCPSKTTPNARRASVNTHPDSGVDRSSLVQMDSWRKTSITSSNKKSDYDQLQRPNPGTTESIAQRGRSAWYYQSQSSENNDDVEWTEKQREEKRLRNEEAILNLSSGLAKMVLKEQDDLEARMAKEELDPRLSSRSPGANTSLVSRPRYTNPINSSPSRTLREVRTDGVGNRLQSFTIKGDDNNVHKRMNSNCDEDNGNTESDSSATNYNDHSSPTVDAIPEASGHVKLFPYHILSTQNKKLPMDVDRTCLEKHLTDTEFELIFNMPREDFWLLPKWKRIEAKKKVHLF